MANITIETVKGRGALRQFIMFPWEIYRNDPYWVPPLIMDMKKILDRKKNPFFLHSEAEYFLARRNGKIVGRIAAIHNRNHNAFHHENIGFFGFFESVNDKDVARALIETVESWSRERGLDGIRGPMNFTTNDTCGMLIEGFDSIPFILMTHNPPYYNELLESAGYEKVMDLLAYKLSKEKGINPRISKIANLAREKEGVTVRPLNMKKFDEEVDRIKVIYNNAWAQNWGFVPMTDEEFRHLAKDLKPAVDPDLVLLAEVEGEPAAFALSLPNYNVALQKVNGRLFPFGLPKLLYYSRKIDAVRVITLGVIKKYQNSRGIGPLLYEETFKRGTRKGYNWGEFSWILETNKPMNSALQILGATVYKRYRIYERKLT